MRKHWYTVVMTTLSAITKETKKKKLQCFRVYGGSDQQGAEAAAFCSKQKTRTTQDADQHLLLVAFLGLDS